MEKDIELSPCLFCESEDLHFADPGYTEVWVTCNTCGASGPAAISPRFAAEKWNNNKFRYQKDMALLTVSGKCKKYSIQCCHDCSRIECGDNTNPLVVELRKLRENTAKSE